MTDPLLPGWPPSSLHTDRLELRGPEPTDRDALIELLCSPLVRAHLGGPVSRERAEAAVEPDPVRRPGEFVVARDGALIGVVSLSRRAAGRPGRVDWAGGDLELSYVFLPTVWGRGYAVEACRAVIAWVERRVPGEPLVLCTQLANRRSLRLAERLGFAETDRFIEFDVEQWFGVRRSGGHPVRVAGGRAAASGRRTTYPPSADRRRGADENRSRRAIPPTAPTAE